MSEQRTDVQEIEKQERTRIVTFIRGEAAKLHDLGPSYSVLGDEFIALAGEIESGQHV